MGEKSCIICGEDCEDSQKITLPYGSFYVHNTSCTRVLNYAVNDSTPILWLGKGDLMDHDHYTGEELKDVSPNDMIEVAEDASNVLWDDEFFGNIFEGLLEHAAQSLEELKVEKTPLEELPLLIGKLKFKDNELTLTRRMSEE